MTLNDFNRVVLMSQLGLTQTNISERTGLCQTTISYNLRKLSECEPRVHQVMFTGEKKVYWTPEPTYLERSMRARRRTSYQ